MAHPDSLPPQHSWWRRWSPRRTLVSLALVAGALAGGAVLGSTMSAGAATPVGTSTAGTASAAALAPGSSGYQVPQMSGTVTAVGTASVTIRTASATTTYSLGSSSDVDKNGEATLSSLAVGDAVTFNLDPSATTPTINKLHAGTEALDRPSGPPPSGSADQGTPPPGPPATAG
ncbi:MAG: hypothetical protein M3Y91_00800 [Actinomycetota bacterium]|nr:hypothetical protein [Actinomycetota bacterium]